MDTGAVLVVDDDEDILTASRLLLQRQFGHVATCGKPEEIPKKLAENIFDVVLLDMNFGPGESSDKQGLVWLEKILEIDPDIVVVMITAHGSLNTAVQAMQRGASDANVLILGENGTGKELIARELHRQSNRAERGFLTIDMGSISESLFESELFGHKKGAFTDASEDRLGRFQAADGVLSFSMKSATCLCACRSNCCAFWNSDG